LRNDGTWVAALQSGGALGTPSSGTLTNCTFPTLNQNTTGTASGLSGGTLTTSSFTLSSSNNLMAFAASGGNGFFINGSGAAVAPGADNVMSLGTSGFRWTTVYATTGTINTSDANQKEQIADLNAAELAVARRIKGLFKTFKFKDAVVAKGDGARIHVGVIAQDVQAAFAAEGLDANKYGLFCSDDVDGTTVLGVRYDELLAFVIAAL
jgi:hypothetical protein